MQTTLNSSLGKGEKNVLIHQVNIVIGIIVFRGCVEH